MNSWFGAIVVGRKNIVAGIVLERTTGSAAKRAAKFEADLVQARSDLMLYQQGTARHFGKSAERWSKYPGPHAPDGDVGFVSVATLQPGIRAGLDTLKIGGISEVLTNRSGFNIFKVTDRKDERPYTLDEIRAELPEAVAQVQFRERYEAWIAGLRAKAQIKIR